MTKKFFIPSDIPTDFKYIVIGNGYYDLYNTPILYPNQTYTYYRFFNDYDQDIYNTYTRTTGSYSSTLNATIIEPTNEYIYRKDYPQILNIVFIYFLFFIILFNIFTSIIKRGGLLGGLF